MWWEMLAMLALLVSYGKYVHNICIQICRNMHISIELFMLFFWNTYLNWSEYCLQVHASSLFSFSSSLSFTDPRDRWHQGHLQGLLAHSFQLCFSQVSSQLRWYVLSRLLEIIFEQSMFEHLSPNAVLSPLLRTSIFEPKCMWFTLTAESRSTQRLVSTSGSNRSGLNTTWSSIESLKIVQIIPVVILGNVVLAIFLIFPFFAVAHFLPSPPQNYLFNNGNSPTTSNSVHLERSEGQKCLMHLYSGTLAGAVAGAMTTPVDVVKTRLQVPQLVLILSLFFSMTGFEKRLHQLHISVCIYAWNMNMIFCTNYTFLCVFMLEIWIWSFAPITHFCVYLCLKYE